MSWVHFVNLAQMVVPGTYLVNRIVLQTNNISLEYEHRNAKDVTFFKCPKLLLYQRSNSFDVKLHASRYMHLDRNRSLEIDLSSGWNDVISGEINVRAATAGLRVQTSETKVSNGSIELSKTAEAGKVRFGAMASRSIAKLIMPFNLEHEVNDITLKLEIFYTTDNGTFFLGTTESVSIMLPLGVNVQDVFKHKALFSKFTISSATSSPLRLLGSRLLGYEIFEAHSGASLARPLVVFPRQSASMLYRITKSSSTTARRASSAKGSKSSLSLTLNYICLEEEIQDAVTLHLNRVLNNSSLQDYTRLVVPTVLAEIRARGSPYDLERTAVLSEFSTSIVGTVRWRDYFAGLGKDVEQDRDVGIVIEECLNKWQHDTPSIPLISMTDEAISRSRSIIIPVDVPSVTAVHTADLKLLGPHSSIPSDAVVTPLNQPISTSLEIKCTRMWDTALDNDLSTYGEHLEFYYEISGASDTWLIGGKRKGHFKIPSKASNHDSKQKFTFPVILIPLREGFLPFPHVDIKHSPKVTSPVVESKSVPTKKTALVTCETDYKNAGETIRVISDALSTTVSLDASGPQGGAWLLESERRTGNEEVSLG